MGEHKRSLGRLLPLYRAITTVVPGDGQTCSFWWDYWLPCGVAATAFPTLFTHATDEEVTVWKVRELGIGATACAYTRRPGAKKIS